MKTLTGSLALSAGVLIAGSTLAQTAPRGPAPRPGTAPPPAVGTVPPGQPAGETRGTGVGGGTPDAPPSVETGQLLDKGPRWPNTRMPSVGSVPAGQGQTPTNGIGGTGGGRLSIGAPTGPRVINNSESEAPIAAPGGGDQAGPAEAIISTTRSQLVPPARREGAAPVPPVTPAPIPPR